MMPDLPPSRETRPKRPVAVRKTPSVKRLSVAVLTLLVVFLLMAALIGAMLAVGNWAYDAVRGVFP